MSSEQQPTILVIDDRPENRTLIRYLFDAEHRVLEAADGDSGLALAASARPDCILLDVSMPGLTGFEVLERLQTDPRTRETPVIILTATEDSLGAMERALRAGAVDYLTKPIDAHRVTIRVRGAIERGRLLRELQTLRANFISMLVHDLRAPLTVIDGYAQLMKSRLGPQADGTLLRYTRAIDESTKRMLALIRQILDVSKFEVGKLIIERATLDMGRLVTDVVEAFQPAARQQSIKLTAHGADAPQPMVGDVARLEQVIMNLLTNALKFTPPDGSIRVEVAGDGETVTVAVCDSGPGVAPEERPFLFEAFTQATAGRQATTPGTGLGLVICRRLVEAHEGRIWLDDVGPGCRFVVSLPAGGPTA